jgi:hypothetical protein
MAGKLPEEGALEELRNIISELEARLTRIQLTHGFGN